MERRQINYDLLIDAIYDAGASPSLWPSVISSIAASAGAQGGVVFGFSKSRGLVIEYNGALDPLCAEIFKLRHTNNAWVQGMAQRPQNQLVASDSIIKRRDLMQSEFYDEVLRPQQIAHGALATLTAGFDIEIQFSVQKSIRDGPFTSRELSTLRRLVPHVRRSLGVSLRLPPRASPADRASTAIDLFGCPAFTLNRRGELVEINHQAQLLATSGMLPLSKGGLNWSGPSEHRRFLMAMKDVVRGAALRALVIAQETTRFELICAALKNGGQTYGQAAGAPAVVVLLVNARSAHASHSSERHSALAKTLTEAERRVTKAAASGISHAEIARALGISLNTAKTHLRRIYHKLGVKRQAELVLLLNRVDAD
jgi:DNA-binding CsgD family transcriptional regulator